MTLDKIYKEIVDYESKDYYNVAQYVLLSTEDKYEITEELHSNSRDVIFEELRVFGKRIFFTKNLKKGEIIIAQ